MHKYPVLRRKFRRTFACVSNIGNLDTNRLLIIKLYEQCPPKISYLRIKNIKVSADYQWAKNSHFKKNAPDPKDKLAGVK